MFRTAMSDGKNFFTVMEEAIRRNGADLDADGAVWHEFCTDRAPEVRRTEIQKQVADNVASEKTRKITAVPEAAGQISVAGADMNSLARLVKECHKCNLRNGCRQTVFGEGNNNAELMFVGEAPGAEEDAIGRPFVGKSGQLLDKMIQAMQYRREEVFIGNIVKCRPPGNRNPMPEEADACIGYLKRQIELISPKVLVLLGATPLLFLMNLSGIKRHRGTWLEYRGIPVMPTFHPAYLLHSPGDKRLVWEDLKAVMRLLGKTPVVNRRK